jgi:hypothetical protein
MEPLGAEKENNWFSLDVECSWGRLEIGYKELEVAQVENQKGR